MPTSKPRILVVEDERSTRTFIAQTLTREGYDVDVAENGPAALELAAKQQYVLALLDYRMPEMNGVEVYERMAEHQPGVIGVFLTAYPTIDIVFPAIGAGVERVLAKPIDQSELINVIRGCLADAESKQAKVPGAEPSEDSTTSS